MTTLFIVLLILAVFLISFFVLIQNPKGGGMDSSVMGGTGNQFFGVQKSTDILERGTWIFAVIILVLCLASPWFLGESNKNNSPESRYLEKMKTGTPAK